MWYIVLFALFVLIHLRGLFFILNSPDFDRDPTTQSFAVMLCMLCAYGIGTMFGFWSVGIAPKIIVLVFQCLVLGSYWIYDNVFKDPFVPHSGRA